MPERLSAAVFIDRDGTLMKDVDYCGDPREVEVFQGAPEALRKLKERGYKIVIVTNQSGIGRGYFTEQAYRAVEKEVARQTGADLIDGTYFCPHAPAKNATAASLRPAWSCARLTSMTLIWGNLFSSVTRIATSSAADAPERRRF